MERQSETESGNTVGGTTVKFGSHMPLHGRVWARFSYSLYRQTHRRRTNATHPVVDIAAFSSELVVRGLLIGHSPR